MHKTAHNLGKHIILELYDCPAHLLESPEQSKAFLLEAARKMGAIVVSADFHAFSPYGVSGVIVIKESHLTIHTWPEHRYAAVDIFTCGVLDINAGIEYLKKCFQSGRSWYKKMDRGVDLVANLQVKHQIERPEISSVQSFYDHISQKYTDLLDRAIPRYREMLETILHYIPSNIAPLKILELGCGTGNLTELIIDKYPQASLVVVDISRAILEECKKRFRHHKNIQYHQADFNDLDLEENDFDLVLSSIAIHHIQDEKKQHLFKKIRAYLKPNGLFLFSDQCKGATNEIYQKHIAQWKIEAFKLGSSESDWDLWMEHQHQHDFHATAKDQMSWMKAAGFKDVDILWRNLLWVVFSSSR